MQGLLDFIHVCVCTSTQMQDGTWGVAEDDLWETVILPLCGSRGLISGYQGANDHSLGLPAGPHRLVVVFESQLIVFHWRGLHGCSRRSHGNATAGRAQSHSVLNLQSQVSHFSSPWDLANKFPSGWVFFDLPFRRVSKGWCTATAF